MAFVNKEGMSISYESSELIEELECDITEFGEDTMVYVWCIEKEGVVLYINYDFIEEDEPLKEDEVSEEEYIIEMSMGKLLILLEKQNSIF